MRIIFLFWVFAFPIITNAQLTYIPDDAFEQYLETELVLYGFSNGVPNDNYVNTAAVEICAGIDINSLYPVQSLSGIENFTALKSIFLSGILVSNLDISALSSNPYAIKIEGCPLLSTVNLPTSDSWALIDFTGNNSLTSIQFGPNSTLSGSQLAGIVTVTISGNAQLTSFDVSNLPLTSTGYLYINNNPVLECVNLKNGFCVMWSYVQIAANYTLDCVQVDNPAYSESSPSWTNWISNLTDPGSYSTSCSSCLATLNDLSNIGNYFSVAPNPSNEQLTIVLNQESELTSYSFNDQQGRIVKTGLLTGKKTTIDLDLNDGMYYLMVGSKVNKVQVVR
jgi:hypothetical protein